MRKLRDALLRCEKHAAGHYGILSRAEALDFGMTKRTIDSRLAEGEWIRVLPGVFRIAGYPETWRGKLHAALLWAGPGAFVSHQSAAAIYGLEGFKEGPVVITAPDLHSIPGVKVHRLRRPARTRVVDGIVVSWVERTLLDVCAVAEPTRSGSAMDDALRKKLTTLKRLWEELAKCGSGVRGTKYFRILVTGRDDRDGKLQSKLEAKILGILRTIKDETFEAQYPILAGGRRYRLDFFHVASYLGIEGHSFTWHFGKSPHDRDAERHNDLTLAGIRMLYITWDHACFKPDEVRATILEAIRVAISYL
jgi:hypothetical protein